MTGTLIVFLALALLVIIVLIKTAVVVPQQTAVVVERLGRYAGTLDAGFHVLFPSSMSSGTDTRSRSRRSTSRPRSASRGTTCRWVWMACCSSKC